MTSEISEIRVSALPQTSENTLHLQSIVSLVSAGTETTVALAEVPHELHQTMRVPFMQGEFALPCTYGYSLVARVIAGQRKWLGKHVHILHPHQSEAVVGIEHVSELPEGLKPEQAVLVSNVETVINAIWDSQCQLGEPVVIAGFGSVGSLLALTLKHTHSGPIYVVERNKERARVASQLGLTVIDWQDLEDCVVAFNASASEQALQACIDAVGFEGRVVELSWYGTKRVCLQLGHDFHSKRKQLWSSQVSNIPAHKGGYWSITKRKQLAFNLIAEGTYSELPQNVIPFSQAPELFTQLRKKQAQPIMTLFNYEDQRDVHCKNS